MWENYPSYTLLGAGSYECLEEILKAGADVNVTDGYGNTTLMVAAEEGNSIIVQLLLDNGAEVNAENYLGTTAVDLAIFKGHSEKSVVQPSVETIKNLNFTQTVYLLLQTGAKVNQMLSDTTFLSKNLNPTELLKSDTQMMKILMAAGIELEHELFIFDESLQHLARKCIRNHLSMLHQETNLYVSIPQLGLPKKIMSYLLFYTLQKVERNLKSDEKEFLWNTYLGNIDFILSLIDAGVDVNTRDKNDKTAMMIAAESGKVELLEKLKQQGADVNIQTYYGDTALICATRKMCHRCIEKLLKFGANIDIKGENGQTALMHAANNDDCHEVLETLIEAGANLNVQDDYGCSALVNATICHFKSLETLLNAGAGVNLAAIGGITALATAASMEKLDCLKKLIATGADLNYYNKNTKKTALMFAAHSNKVKCVEELIQAGADLNFSDVDGRTALIIAAEKGSFESVRILLKAGAEVDTSFLLDSTKIMIGIGNRERDR